MGKGEKGLLKKKLGGGKPHRRAKLLGSWGKFFFFLLGDFFYPLPVLMKFLYKKKGGNRGFLGIYLHFFFRTPPHCFNEKGGEFFQKLFI